MRPLPRRHREGWSASGGSFYHPGNHTVSRADAVAGLVLYASLLGALAAMSERTAPPSADTILHAQASPSGVEAVARRKAGC